LDVHRVVSSPGATGIVLDANTAEPIARAQVAVARYCPPAAAEPFDDPITVSNALHFVRWPRVKTDQAGSFSVPPKHKLIAIILFGDYFGRASGSLVVQHPGYQTKVIPISVLVPIEVATNGYGRKVLLNRIRK
jgi:hypothetical protein